MSSGARAGPPGLGRSNQSARGASTRPRARGQKSVGRPRARDPLILPSARPITMDIAIVFLLIALNGFFAMSEMALVSARKVRLQRWADEGNPGAARALELAERP